MNAQQKDRWMKKIVRFCLGFCTVFSVAAFVSLWFGIDASDILRTVTGLFGGELLMTCLIKLIDGKIQNKETKKEDTYLSDI